MTEWVEIRSGGLDEALWFRAALQAAGIEAVVPDEHTPSLPLQPEVDPGIRLLVRAGDLQRAYEVMAAHPLPAR